MDMETLTRVGRAFALLTIVAVAAGSAGCRQLRGRKLIQDGSELFKRGKYVEAVARFAQAEPLVPEMPVLWLNKGYTCRQLIVPGVTPTPALRPWATCALEAFTRLRRIAPGDPRGEQLYMQTLFDTNDFAALEGIFLAQNRAAQDRGTVDLEAATGLQQVYFKQGRWAAALSWARKAADARPTDADAQYRLGAFIWHLLSSRGGGATMSAFDPRPVPPPAGGNALARGHAKHSVVHPVVHPVVEPVVDPVVDPVLHPVVAPPSVTVDDISGALRSELADEGIRYLEKTLALHPRHPEAMVYLNLLYRQKSFAFFAEPDKWQAAVDQANQWQQRGLEARGNGASKL
jgi:tetratricopeptide (TPR) repeat protein